MLGAGLLFGDGMITPAISVLSAVEGLEVATPALRALRHPDHARAADAGCSPSSSRAPRASASSSGRCLLVWFVVIAVLGARADRARIRRSCAAFNPVYGLRFLGHAGFHEALLILGALMLVVTGGEAMYADLGHFGARPIRVELVRCRLSRAARQLSRAGRLSAQRRAGGERQAVLQHGAGGRCSIRWSLLATVATVIASQALISGAFSLVSQAIGIGLLPRIAVQHTHRAHAGQIYIPFVNWALFLGCVALVVAFGSTSALAAAYGLAVAGVMLITSLAMFAVARRYWRWSAARAALVWGPLTAVNAAFLVASSLKFLEGGFVPLTVGVAAFAVMATWRWGRKATFAAYTAQADDDDGGAGRRFTAARPHLHRAQRPADVALAAAPLRAIARPPWCSCCGSATASCRAT